MEKSPNSTEEEEALTKKLHELLAESDNEETEKFCFQEEKVEEMMQELYKEITFSTSHAPPNPPIFIDDAKNGSCGALVSSSKSTIMAGIEVVSSTGRFPVTKIESAVAEKVGSSKTLFGFRVEKNERRKYGFNDEDHLDCEWVGRVLRNWLF